MFCAWSIAAPANAGNVDLNTWSQRGAASAGTWNVQGGGASVLQTVNGAPTFFVSPNDFFNTTVEGGFGVQTTSDDDFIGFVFGYQAPAGTGNDVDFLIFDWKQGTQSGASAGFRLAKAQGTHNGGAGTSNEFWAFASDASITFDVLGTNYGIGWADNTNYDFRLGYTAANLQIFIQGGTGPFATETKIFDVNAADHPSVFPSGMFPSGKFGFYNHSQAQVNYESFSQTDPELSTNPDDGGGFDLLTRVGTPINAVVTVTNTGGAGTLLTGAAGSPAGPLHSGPAESASYSLGSGADTDFTYTYSPITRTLGTPDTDLVNISSNDPNDTNGHDMNLSGVAVGPVAAFAFDSEPVLPNDILDFGSIDQNDMRTLLLSISNTTTDDNGGNEALTDLTLNSFALLGTDADKFELLNFVPGQVIHKGNTFDLQINFDPASTVGLFDDATVTFLADEGTVLGGDGTDYAYSLVGQSVPEPSALALLAMAVLGLLGLACYSWRRRK